MQQKPDKPLTTDEYCAWLRDALAEFHRLWPKHQDSVCANYDWMHQSEYRQAKRTIASQVHPSTENPLIAACHWWREREPGFAAETQRLRHLWQLLRCLDETYSFLPLTPPVGGLLLGQRWWNRATRMDSGRGLLDKATLTPGYRFPHLRAVDLQSEEWISLTETQAAFAPVRKAKMLRIGLCCLSGKARTFFRPTRVLMQEKDTVGFLAQSIGCGTATVTNDDGTSGLIDQEYAEELRECVRWAREKGLHILCFPELCICPSGLAVLQEAIDDDSGELSLVLPGSYHSADISGVHSNTAPIWLVEHGRVRHLPVYEKADPMVIAAPKDAKRKTAETAGILSVSEFADQKGCGSIKEDIREGSAARLLYTPVGVIAVTICKDLLLPERTHLQQLADAADMILVLSMNATSGWFWNKAIALSFLGTAVFFVNTPQMVAPTESGTEIVFWHLPALKHAAPARGTRVCLCRTTPTGRGGGTFGKVSADGRELCELDFSDERFAGLMTEL